MCAPDNQDWVQPGQKQPQTISPQLTFTTAKIIDYKHAHIPTLYEQLMEFKVFRVTDYKHRTTPKLQEIIRDVDIDKIIEERKQI